MSGAYLDRDMIQNRGSDSGASLRFADCLCQSSLNERSYRVACACRRYLGGRAILSGGDEILATDKYFIPQQHHIYSNYPNPFNPVTTLPIYLETPSDVSYYVVDLQGRQIIQRDFPLLNAGYHEFDINLGHVSSGVYFYQFTINDIAYTPS